MSVKRALLKITAGSRLGSEFTIEVGAALVVGRESGSLALADPQVSRLHAQVRIDESGNLEVSDLGSRNGTWLNGKPVLEPTVVTDGDLIRVGSTEIVVNVTEGNASELTPPSATLASGLQRARPALAATPYPQPFTNGAATSISQTSIATRQPIAMTLTFLAVIFTAIALVLYFALR